MTHTDTVLYPTATLPRYTDGPDTFHVTTRTNQAQPALTGLYSLSVGHTHDEELYKVRNKPHLYDDWHVDMVNEHRAIFVADVRERYPDVLDRDCHHCKRAILTQGVTHRCPNCGWPL